MVQKDNSLSILEEYASKDNRIKIINQENQGQELQEIMQLKYPAVNILHLLTLMIGLN